MLKANALEIVIIQRLPYLQEANSHDKIVWFRGCHSVLKCDISLRARCGNAVKGALASIPIFCYNFSNIRISDYRSNSERFVNFQNEFMLKLESVASYYSLFLWELVSAYYKPPLTLYSIFINRIHARIP